MLASAAFTRIYDRWDIRVPAEGGAPHALAVRLIRSSRLTKLLADVCVPNCSYAAVK